MAFGFFVIPLLLFGRPNLLDATVKTLEGIVNVEIGNATVSVDVGKVLSISRYGSWRSVARWHMWWQEIGISHRQI